ncbi:bifunctional Delta(1)-pyrroline-2-carboxylate/Delta(1)-piperideine-2-carboxylate reductase [Roseomonas elaeocarpi]|uniref:Ornithine cyclodeaminase family protein n=1 Tax=Roseomonas elaeocarpi TaxID=907779 RepID=A0ABV6JXH7_9PROT
MHHMDRPAVAAALPWPALIEALHDVFRTGCEAPLRHRHALPPSGGQPASLLLMPAWQAESPTGGKGGGYTGVKVVHVMPGNAALGVPAVQSAFLLSSGTTGELLAVLDGGELTDRRTAAASVLAAGFLARPDSRRLLILGSGRVAQALAECYRSAFPLEDVAVWSRRAASAEALVATLRAHGHPARLAARGAEGEGPPEAELAAADIIAAATLSDRPLVRGAAVRPGTHVDLVGAFRPEMRESDGALLRRALLAVDTRPGALAEAGDVVQAIAEGAITEAEVAADLFALCRGEHPGRTDPAEVTVFKSVGWAGEDLAAAAMAFGNR